MRTLTAAAMTAALIWITAAVPVCAQDQTQGGQPGGQGQTPVPGIGDANFDPNQPIRPGMVISVSVTSAAGTEEALTGVFTVDASGAIQLKLAGRVEIKGLTPSQAGDKIAASLKTFVKEPKAAVAIISVPRTIVFMTGAVTKPGAIAVSENVTLAEVLTLYGYNDTADLSKVRVLHRDDKGARMMKEYDFTRWLKPLPGEKPDEANNPVLSDRDIVFVPSRTNPAVGIISVEGDVSKAAQIPVRNGVSTRLREAISQAGGINPTADHKITIRRYGVANAITVDYDRMEAGDPQSDIELRPDDVVYVNKMDDTQYINLIGGLMRAGKLPYRRSMTLTQAIADAGGFALYSKEKEGHVFRHPGGSGDPTRTQVIPFNFKKLRENKEADIALLPGDTVEIQQGGPPRPPLDPLSLASSLLSIALIVDRLTGGRSSSF